MKHSIIRIALLGLAWWMISIPSLAVEPQPQNAKQPTAAEKAMAAKKNKPAAPQVELVDINSASKEELKKLPGIDDADAVKIIAGRPYLTKAHLQTHNVVSPGVYLGLRHLVVARQKGSKFAKEVRK